MAVMSSTIGDSFSQRLRANLLMVLAASRALQLLDLDTKFCTICTACAGGGSREQRGMKKEKEKGFLG